MKLPIVVLIFASLQVTAKTAISQKITVSFKNAPLETVLNKIETQSGYNFFYDKSVLKAAAPVTLNIKEASIMETLKRCFSTQKALTYLIVGKVIIVKQKTNTGSEAGATSPVLQPVTQLKVHVTDSVGEPLHGASVRVANTSIGGNTDSDGNIQLSGVQDDATLIITYIGYKTIHVATSGKEQIHVTLFLESTALNEIVVVGYGTQLKREVSGAITTVNTKDVSMSPESNLAAGLAGRVSGVIITDRGGETGNEGIDVFIRGRSTTGDASPLYVVDGIVRDYGGISYLNPDEIQSITVLKDASAAIYGSRAANGVILVTTKRGVAGKPTITASYNQAIQQPMRIPETASAYDYASTVNLEQRIKGLPLPYSDKDLQQYKDGTDPLNHPNTSWADLIFRKWSDQRKADISVSGGNKDARYFLSAGYLSDNSPFKESFTYNKVFSFRSNIDVDITKDLKVSLDLSGRRRDNTATHFDWAHIYLGLPTQNGIYPNGLIGPGRGGNNAVLMARDPNYGYTNNKIGTFMGTLSATYKIPGITGLSLQGNFAYDQNNVYAKDWTGVTYYYLLDPATGDYNKMQNSQSAFPSLMINSPQSTSITTNIKVNYKRTFSRDHTIDAFLGFEQNQTDGYELSAGRTNFASSSLEELFAGSADKNNQSNNGSSAVTARENYFGRVQYSYRDKYNLQFQFRYDGSQNFPVGRRYGFFPGISGSWNISKEAFLINESWLDNLKLRASYGEMGNDKVGPYQYLTSYTYGSNYAFDGVTNQGLIQTGAPNPNITWEVAKTTDIGLETSILKGLLSAEIDVFSTKRSNILATRNASVPDYTGLVLPNENIGIVENKGVELSLRHFDKINENLNYTVQGNFTYVSNKVVFQDELPDLPVWQRATGKPVGSGLLYEAIGIFKDAAQLAATAHLPGATPGDLILKDMNNDGTINSLDLVRQDVNSTPKIVYGLNFNINYKQFELNLGFQGQGKAINNRFNVAPYDPLGWGNFATYMIEDGWTPENTDGTKPKPGSVNGFANTTFTYADASFLKLKTAELAYNMSTRMLSKAGIKALRIYLSGSNLFFIHDHFKDVNLDPELTNSGWGMSQQRVINLGINFTF